MRRRAVRTACLLGLFGGLVALWATSSGDGYLEFRAAITTVAIAWGAGIGALVGGLAGASPARTMLPLGLGAILGGIGAIGGMAFAVHVLGHDLLDGDRNIQLTSAFVGAGLGWIAGAATGAASGRDVPPLTPSQIRAARFAAIAIVALGLGLAVSLGRSADLRADQGDAGSAQIASIADAILVAATLAFVAGTSPKADPATPSLMARTSARAGLTIGSIVLVTIAACQPGTELDRRTRERVAANAWTATSLAGAGVSYAERTGRVPDRVETLVEAGGMVAPGSHVNGVWLVTRGFCVEVGTDADRSAGVAPLQSVLVRFATTGSDGLRMRTWSGGVGGCETLDLT